MDRRGRESRKSCAGWAAIAVLLGAIGPSFAQDPPRDLPSEYTDSPSSTEITLAGCAGCGAGGGSIGGDYGPAYPVDSGGWGCCGSGGCVGHRPCYDCHGKTCVGRFFCCLYECICCPDPCYEGRWTPVADAGFFIDAVRPITQQRIRYDSGQNVILVDRANYLWSPPTALGGLGPPIPETGLRYNELTMYTEAASKLASIWVETPYKAIQSEQNGHFAGFGDIKVGTKTLLFDCELIQIGMQMKTSMPSASPVKGLGNGVFSLEPSLMVGIKVGPETYMQWQVAEWIPFSGIPAYQGPILHYHLSVNHVVCKPLPNVPVIATFEFAGWSFQDGAYSNVDPNIINDPSFSISSFQPTPAGGYAYIYLGGGLRVVICDRLDFGFGCQASMRSQHWADPLYRTEFRLRF